MALRAARLTGLLVLVPTMLGAQITPAPLRSAHSTDYLFAADVQDARALWINPAGLGTYLQASIMGEIVADRLIVPGGSVGFAQYTIGFNSRGFSLGYSHDRFEGTDSTNSTIRVGLARAFTNVSVGASMAFYSADVKGQGLDLGVRYQPSPVLALAAVVHDIGFGRPVLRDSVIHAAGVAGATAYLLGGQATLSGEVRAMDRPALQSGYDVTYRAGASLRSGGAFPIAALVALDLANNVHVDRWTIGLSLGGTDRVVGTTSVESTAGASELSRIAITGVATRRPPR